VSKITIELTEEQAEALAKKVPGQPTSKESAPFLEAALAARFALAAHRQKQEREALGLPWRANNNGGDYGWSVLLGGMECSACCSCSVPQIVALSEPQARLMSAAPEMADALGPALKIMEGLGNAGIGGLEPTREAARAALKKAGR
jgi:hypothetical protein